jgi:hypothetical protein
MSSSGGDAVVRPNTIRVEASALQPTIATRSYFSTYQLWAAENSAARAAEIEAAYVGHQSRFEIEHRANVLGAITMSAGSLEAMVNELFADAAEGHGTEKEGVIAPLSERTRELMGTWWDLTGHGWERVLEKYQLLLLFAEQPPLDTGAQPYQDAALLVGLRNVIVHYRPETISSVDPPHRLTRKLKPKFASNALMSGSTSERWWPDHALGAGAAAWACTAARALADEVTSRLGVRPNYKRVGAAWWPVEQHRTQTGPPTAQ